MKRRLFVGGAFAGLSISQTFAAPQKVKAGDIPVIALGKTGLKVSMIAQGEPEWTCTRLFKRLRITFGGCTISG